MISTFNLAALLVFRGISICLDPGHGGTSTGASGVYALEKDVVLDVALQLQSWLGQVPGISRVALTRDGDYDVSLIARSSYANANGFDRFISVHENAFNGSVQGTETFCGSLEPSDPSYQLALKVQEGILACYGYADRGVKYGGYLHVIRETEMPAVLGEGSFLDYDLNWNESYLYAFNVDDHLGVQAWAYAGAVCAHFGLEPPAYGTGAVMMDNTFAGFSLSDSVYWEEQVSGAPWMINCMVTQASPEVWARWEPAVPVEGVRTVQLWWTSGMDRSTSARFLIHHAEGVAEELVNQASQGEMWFELGDFTFSGGCTVELLGEGSSPGVLCADAVRLVQPMSSGPSSEGSGIRVLQNPAPSFVFILPSEEGASVDIYDAGGRLVETLSGSGSIRWSAEGCPSGLYFALERGSFQANKLVLIR